MAKEIRGDIVRCDHGREAPLPDQERLDRETREHGEEQGSPGRHACTVCAWRMGYDAAVEQVMQNLRRALLDGAAAAPRRGSRSA